MKRYKSLFEKAIQIDISFVKDICNKVKNQIINSDLGNIEIADILNKEFLLYGIYFDSGMGSSAKGSGIIQAYTNSNGDIIIEYSDTFWEEITVDKYQWKEFCLTLEAMIGHELIHREQIFKSKTKLIIRDFSQDDSPKEYMSNKYELMSFAKEAVLQFLTIGYNKKQIINLIKKPFSNNSPDRRESDIFFQYTEWFEGDEKPFKQFLKYMYEYLK